MYSRQSPQVTECFISMLMCQKSQASQLCALYQILSTLTSYRQTQKSSCKKRSATCHLKSQTEICLHAKIIWLHLCRSPNANNSLFFLNAFNIYLACNWSLYDLNISVCSKDGITTQEGITYFWQTEVELKNTTFSNNSDSKMLLTNSQFLPD